MAIRALAPAGACPPRKTPEVLASLNGGRAPLRPGRDHKNSPGAQRGAPRPKRRREAVSTGDRPDWTAPNPILNSFAPFELKLISIRQSKFDIVTAKCRTRRIGDKRYARGYETWKFGALAKENEQRASALSE